MFYIGKKKRKEIRYEMFVFAWSLPLQQDQSLEIMLSSNIISKALDVFK